MFSDENASKLDLWLRISQSCGWWHPFGNICFLCERPSVQSINAQGRLHLNNGPALLCRDGFPIYALNGIRMKPEHVLTTAEMLSPETVLAETNADIRRELIRKVGVERMLAKLPHKVLEKRGNYELLSIRLSDEVRDARYLKMINPSVGCFHVEGVAPECKTVNESLNWRNSQWFENAEALT
jgi:hypothetical protein